MNRPRIQAAAEMMLEAQQKACPDESWRVILGAGAVLAKACLDADEQVAHCQKQSDTALRLLQCLYTRFASNIRGHSRNLHAEIKAFLDKRQQEEEYE